MPRLRDHVAGIARVAFLAVATALLVWAVVTEHTALDHALRRLQPWTFPLVVLTCAAAVAVPVIGFRALLTDLGWTLPVSTCARVFYLGQLGKYVPGGIWQFLAVTALGAQQGVPAHVTLLASSILLVLTLAASLVLAAVTLPLLSQDASGQWWPVLLALPAIAALAHPRVVNPLVRAALRWSGRGELDRPLSGGAVAQALGWVTLSLAGLGAATWFLLVDLGHGGLRTLLVATGAFALAWAVGLVVVIAPAGAGVREGALALALGGVLARPSALLVALVLRAATAVADLLLAAGSVLSVRWARYAARRAERGS